MRQGCDRERKSGAPSQPEPHANSQNMVDTQDMLVGRMAGKRGRRPFTNNLPSLERETTKIFIYPFIYSQISC